VKVPRSGGQACRKAGSAEGAAWRPLPGRLRRITGSMPDNKANGTLTALIIKSSSGFPVISSEQIPPVIRAVVSVAGSFSCRVAAAGLRPEGAGLNNPRLAQVLAVPSLIAPA